MANTEFLAAYLAVGADDLKRKVVLERLVKRIAAMGDLDFNQETFMGSAVQTGDISAACNTLPFACPYRLVIVKDADKLPKAAQEEVIEYLAAPSETTILALEAVKLAKNTRLYKAVAKVGKKAVIDCAPPKTGRDLGARVRDFALSEGVTITPAAADELVERVGDSTVHLDTELKKLAAALGRGAEVTVEHVRRYVTRTAEIKPWVFTDALAARDARKVAWTLAAMPQQSLFGLLSMSVTRIRELLIAKDLRGAGQRALAQELGKQDWQVRNHMRWADGFAPGELEHALVAAADLDRAMKSGGDQQVLFERWALEVCQRA